MRFPALIFLLAVCCRLTNGCSKGVTRRTAATVFSVKGTVVFGMAEQNNFRAVTRESRRRCLPGHLRRRMHEMLDRSGQAINHQPPREKAIDAEKIVKVGREYKIAKG